MSIVVHCPKGHVLKVKNSMAGKTGLCPFCKGQVYVYVPIPEEKKDLSEESILDFLGSAKAKSDTNSSGINLEDAEVFHRQEKHQHDTPWKSCVKCNREIPAKIHICPFCHTYIADLAGF